VVPFDHATGAWNLRRLQTLILAAQARSMNRLKIITIGEAARFMMCAAVYGVPGVPVLSIPDPSPEALAQRTGSGASASPWVEWAADLLAVGREG
jgi:hypothetical protein